MERFSAKRRREKENKAKEGGKKKPQQTNPLCVFQLAETLRKLPQPSLDTRRLPAQTRTSHPHTEHNRGCTGGEGRGKDTLTRLLQASAGLKSYLKETAETDHRYPRQAWVRVCATHVAVPALRILPTPLGTPAGQGNNVAQPRGCCPHCLASETAAGTGSASQHWPERRWRKMMLDKGHPPKVQRDQRWGMLVPLVLPSANEAGKWEVAGGSSRHLEILCAVHFQLLSLYVAHESEKHL